MSNLNCASCGKSISLAQRYLSHDSRPMCSICYTEPQQNFDVRRIYLRPSAGAAEQLSALAERPPRTFGPIEIRQRTPEEVDNDPLSQWAKHVILSDHNLSHADAIAALREWVGTLETLLAGYKGIIDALPPCPKHGAGCVCQAKLWIDRAKAVMRED